MNHIVAEALASEPKNEINFEIGDTVRVLYKIIESGKERIQTYEGVVIAIASKGHSKTFTVRRISYDIGVERIFPLHSPRISKIELIRKGKVRRAKLYYLRSKTGKAGRIKERKGGQAMVSKEKKRQDDKAKAATAVATEPASETPAG